MLQCISAAFKKEAPGEGFEPPCATHRRYPVLRFRGVRRNQAWLSRQLTKLSCPKIVNRLYR